MSLSEMEREGERERKRERRREGRRAEGRKGEIALGLIESFISSPHQARHNLLSPDAYQTR